MEYRWRVIVVTRPLPDGVRRHSALGRPGRRRGEAASVALLFPVAVLIVAILAAITVDFSIVFLGQREVANSVAAAANDAATVGVGNRAFYRAGVVELDGGAADRLARQRVQAALDPDRFHDLRVDVTVAASGNGCPPTVRVHASATVAYVFARAVPSAPSRATVEATSVAGPAQSDPRGC